MAQQTAVEWLIEQLEQQVYRIDHKDNRIIPKSFDDIVEIQKQAKQMEKEQIIKFALDLHKVDCSKTGTDILVNEAEQYYNEQYKNKIK